MNEYDLYGAECRVIALPGALASAGVEYEFPGVVAFQIEAVTVTLHTVAGGAARQLTAKLLDSTGTPVYGVAAPGTQAGNLTVVYSFAPLLTAGGTSALGFQQAPFIGPRIAENLTLAVNVSGTSAADAITSARLLVRQWQRVHPDE